MVRASLDPRDYDFQINALPLAPSGRNGQIESIGRVNLAADTDDLPGTGVNYGGDTTDFNYCTYPDIWLRIQRQGDKFISYFATTNITDFPSGASPGSTNGWQLLVVCNSSTTNGATSFPKTVYVGLSTVAHNSNINDATHTVTSTYADYGPTPGTPSIPSLNGVAVAASNAPGPFPIQSVRAVNWHVSLPANGLGYPGDIVQSAQGAPSQIIWNSGGATSVSRDLIVDYNTDETPDGFSVARYHAGTFDFAISPRDPVAARTNLGTYSNLSRERFGTGNISVPACEAWAPSPNYGFAINTVRKNGQQWNDTSPFFYAAAYMQLDGIATGQAYDMTGGHFRGGQFYTRTTKLITGSPLDPSSDTGPIQRAAISTSIAYFPYAQGWKAGYFEGSGSGSGIPLWKRGNGFGLHSGTAVSGLSIPQGGQSAYNSPSNILSWIDPNGSGNLMAQVQLPGVNSQTDGLLFTVANDEGNSLRGNYANNAARSGGNGWDVWVRGIEESKSDPTLTPTDNSGSFSFLYIPFNSDNLVGGTINPNGTTKKGAGTFSVTRLAAGRYALTIPGKSESTGMLLLENSGYLSPQPAGYTNVTDTCFLSYEYGGTNTPANAFIIESRYIDPSAPQALLRDCQFNFVYVDFLNPLAPPGTTPPVMTITRSGSNVIVSWTNGPGFILQSTSSLTGTPTWSNLGTANPQTIPITGSGQFFRVVHP
jgi:hypothetical protein